MHAGRKPLPFVTFRAKPQPCQEDAQAAWPRGFDGPARSAAPRWLQAPRGAALSEASLILAYVNILVASAKLSRPTRRMAGSEANTKVTKTPPAVKT